MRFAEAPYQTRVSSRTMIRLIERRRFTLAGLMIVVAASALFLGGGLWGSKMWARHKVAMREAEQHARQVRLWRYCVQSANGEGAPVSVTRTELNEGWRRSLQSQGYDTTRRYFYGWYLAYNPWEANKAPRDPRFEELMAICRERLAYHERMWRKWSRASWTPWTRFEPDPPMPPVLEPDVSQSY
jgi:hypothetical protein